jgi:lipoprotein-anchoring transpeptidase ErfK/SrfK
VSTRRRLSPWVVAAGALLVTAGGLSSCATDRPTLGKATVGRAAPTVVTTSAPVGDSSPVALSRPVSGSDLLGYIATPNGTPQVHTQASLQSPVVDIPATTDAGAPTTFAIVGDPTTGSAVPAWYQVLLPTRPNGTLGWVQATAVALTKTPFRIQVDLPTRTLTISKDGDAVFQGTIAIGTPENPTPIGATYVTELIRNTDPAGSYGPYAFGLALHSNTLTEFNGGTGQVGIHGTSTPATIGQRVSHGCIRMTNADITTMKNLALPLGVPVVIS